MIPVIPWYITLTVVAGAVAVVLAVTFLFSQAAARSGLTPAEQRSVRLGVAGFLGVWLAAVIIAAPSLASLAGADPYALTMVIPFFAVAGPLLVMIGYGSFPLFRRALNGLSVSALIGVQVYRVLGASFILLLAQGQLPAHFAQPAGYGDIAIGLLAPVVALLYARGVRWPAVLWSAVGITDLLVAVGMGTGFATPLLLGVPSRLHAAAAMGAYPMILVPAFAVPIAMMLHVVALRGMVRGRSGGAVLATAPARSPRG